MNHKEIKEAKANGYSNWEILQMCIDKGQEYPDAVYRVSAALKMKDDERQQMEKDYDECC